MNTANYSDEVTGFARVNPRFLLVVEKAFADFVASQKKIQVLPHMPPDRRKFVQDVSDCVLILIRKKDIKVTIALARYLLSDRHTTSRSRTT